MLRVISILLFLLISCPSSGVAIIPHSENIGRDVELYYCSDVIEGPRIASKRRFSDGSEIREYNITCSEA